MSRSPNYLLHQIGIRRFRIEFLLGKSELSKLEVVTRLRNEDLAEFRRQGLAWAIKAQDYKPAEVLRGCGCRFLDEYRERVRSGRVAKEEKKEEA
jgi:hypothetical protein